MAVVRNTIGFLPIGIKTGMVRTAKNLARSFTKAGQIDLEVLREMGGFRHDTIHQSALTEHFSDKGSAFSRKFLRATGFNWINTRINMVAALSAKGVLYDDVALLGDPTAGARAKKSARARLVREFEFTDAQVDSMVKDGVPGPNEIAQAVQQIRGKVNVSGESPLSKQRWMNNKWARILMAYQSYNRAMGNVWMDVVEATKDGDYRPMARVVFGSAPVGIAGNALYGFLKRRDEEDEDFKTELFRAYLGTGTFGLVGSLGEQLYWSRVLQKESPMGIPALEFWWALAEGGYDAAKTATVEGEPTEGAEDAFNTVVKQVPMFKAVRSWYQYLEEE